MKYQKTIILLLLIGFNLILTGCIKKQEDLELTQTQEEKEVLRDPAVSGAFYPDDKTVLINKIESFLKKADFKKTKEPLRILVVPHAGYDYSGQTAAWGFKQLQNSNYSKIILIGNSHQAYFSNAAVYNQGAWKTPLGDVEIDQNLANTLINQSKLIIPNLTTHEQEHSLEVELPFLQQILKDYKLKIVPILLGQTDNQSLETIAQVLFNNFDDSTLLVVSSDLSHYPDYQTANKIDKETIDTILSNDIDKFSKIIKDNLNQPGVDTCACGADSIKVAMFLANKANIKNIQLLNYSNSGDTGADKSRVVGYASIGFYGGKLKDKPQLESDQILNKEQQHQLLQFARQTLESYFKDKKIPQLKVEDEKLNQKLGAFVTLNKGKKLRGCIGQFEPTKPLYQVVQDKAIDAALHDSRFSPVKYEELKKITIEISVLSPQQKITDWRKIELGKHGVVIRQGLRGGTFLPQVATDTGWDLETFLSNLCSHKAGLATDCYKDPKVDIYTFTAQVFEEEKD